MSCVLLEAWKVRSRNWSWGFWGIAKQRLFSDSPEHCISMYQNTARVNVVLPLTYQQPEKEGP